MINNGKWEEKDLDFLKENYTNYSNQEIADILNRSKKAISIKASRLGLKFDRKYNYDADFFESIDTEEKAYWLGFLYADGYVSKTSAINTSYTVGIDLMRSDENHLKKFNKSINGNFELVYRERERWNKIHSICSIRVYCKKMVEDLINNGCTYNKTFDIKMPILQEHLIRHFIRGFFDGDGSIFKRKGRDYLLCNITSASEDFLKSIREIIYNIGITSYIVSDRNHFQLGISGKDSAYNFLKYMYEDSTFYLDRKHKLYKTASLPL